MKNILAFLFTISLVLNATSQSENFLEKPYIETRATYTAEVTPDNIFLEILITENDTRGRVPVEELENRMTAKLIELGIDVKKQLKLIDLTSDFKKYLLRKKEVLKNKEYSLLVYDALTASKVIKELESIDISNITLSKTEYSKLEELKIELRGKAVEKAKRQALSMLAPLNQELGKAVFISDLEVNFESVRRSQLSGSNTAYYYNSPDLFSDLEINQTKVQVTVKVFFELN